ncbi:alkyl hydroperoxide reductase subunit F [Pleionea sediminis]|uniref:alkyl hydroperoxide reductase subunit F n=1 Tax=Pleionea sediminis TaxID=2569479 RepID=UPI00118567BF|nr:alkyl hydroperoxide reductase subunit F [Pleionea sediminis]
MLDPNMKTQLKTYLENLKNEIVLTLTLDQQKTSQDLKALAKEIAELSSMVSVEEDGSRKRKPLMTVSPKGGSTKVAFAGLPMGHEFTSLVLALLHAGGHPMKLDNDTIEQIKALTGNFEFKTYISLSCQNCPDVVQSLNMMALINPNIKHTMIDGGLFQEEVDQLGIKAVPSVFLNDESFSQGRITLKEILNKIDSSAAKRDAKKLSEKDVFDMLIVGGGPAGASAAIYSARKGLNTGIVADRFGGQVADTVGIENFISVPYTEGPKLVASLEQHVTDYDVDVMSGQKVKAINRSDLFEIETESGAKLKSKSIVLATGARWRKMNVPGEQEYSGKGVAYCPHCDGPLFKGKRVAVIGGGNSGIEAASDLANIVEHVTVLEFSDVLRADDVLQRKANSMSNIEIIMQAQTTEVLGNGNEVTGLRYIDRVTGDSKDIELSGIFVQIGLVPNSEFLKDTIELSEGGEVIVDERGQSSLPGLFAAGDVTTVPFKQIIIAMGEGSKAALSAFDYLMRLEPSEKSKEQKAA